ncbi:hypothetical protein Q0Z83_086010 [Actinoplanes sichuanensis]|uniref:GerMN domain-containing protein n=1 Tax=Actinoplanes sichuanensis TaxID=512349 RepID=A0ABW4AJJ3_9ACTN|nr:hypothetical protein [Actinoplanes sichuanensis]BEL10410.1 hypothetical protein Q0Z83_086010 [Actinoplanes sichuanensis]
MKPLSELMQEQIRTDAPPLRHTVDDVLAAGRRRERRRNSGWALAAVVAVAAAIGVPQLAGRHPEPTPPPPAATTPAPAPSRGDQIPSAARFTGYQVKKYRVGTPTIFSLGYTFASVMPIKGLHGGGDLRVFEPGVDPIARMGIGARTAADPIRGRPASTFTAPGPKAGLIWEYADGASAVLTADLETTQDVLREVAEGFRLGSETPVTVAFKVGYVPAGFRLFSVSQDEKFSLAHFLPTDDVARQLTGPGRLPFADIGLTKGDLQLIMSQVPVPGDIPDCAHDACRARLVLPGGRYQLDVSGSISEAEAQKVLDSVVLSAPEDHATWIPVEEAVPARYRM